MMDESDNLTPHNVSVLHTFSGGGGGDSMGVPVGGGGGDSVGGPVVGGGGGGEPVIDIDPTQQ